MKRGVWWYLSILLFMAVLAVGGWFRAFDLSRKLPTACEAGDLWAATQYVEDVSPIANVGLLSARATPFHGIAGYCAAFVDERSTGFTLRYYRVFPFVCSLLIVGLIPLLGRYRRGGLFESADGPLWAMAFVACSPVLVWQSMFFHAVPFMVLLFLGMLLTARAYAQWPGYSSATLMGLFCALMILHMGDMLWLVAVLIPAIMVGVGWRRLCLYWRTLHVLTMLFTAAVVIAVGLLLQFRVTPSLPTLAAFQASLAEPILWRLGWLCTGGLGVLAWFALAIGGGFRPDYRWTRVFIVLFPACFMGSLFFDQGGIFVVPLVLLTPIMAGMAVAQMKHTWVRVLIATLLLLSLAVGSWRTLETGDATFRPRELQKQTLARLKAALTAPRVRPYRVRVVSADVRECAELLWIVRARVDRAAYSAQASFTDADILILREDAAASVARPDAITLDTGTSYRLFTTRPTR